VSSKENALRELPFPRPRAAAEDRKPVSIYAAGTRRARSPDSRRWANPCSAKSSLHRGKARWGGGTIGYVAREDVTNGELRLQPRQRCIGAAAAAQIARVWWQNAQQNQPGGGKPARVSIRRKQLIFSRLRIPVNTRQESNPRKILTEPLKRLAIASTPRSAALHGRCISGAPTGSIWHPLTLICKVSCSTGRRFRSRFGKVSERWWTRRCPPGGARNDAETASVVGCKSISRVATAGVHLPTHREVPRVVPAASCGSDGRVLSHTARTGLKKCSTGNFSNMEKPERRIQISEERNCDGRIVDLRL
jgi:hypothetical protein